MSLLTERIRPDAIRTLAGAGYVRERLIALLNMGPDNLVDTAYAIKCRIKSEESLINKVIYKRRVEGKTHYIPSSVTDVVGLRILALTNEQMPTLCRKFVAFIGLAQNPNISLFVGERLDDAIVEVKVYKSSVNSVVYEEIYAYFSSLNISAKKVTLEAATEQDPYSSVHIVALTNSFSRKSSRRIPMEVQIRTVFEDAWAEIDHPLRYKGRSYHEPVKSVNYGGLRKIADRFLTDFKTDVDAALKKADGIQNLYAELFDRFTRQTYSKIKHTPFGPRLEYKSIFHGHLPRSVSRKVGDIDDEMGKFGTEVLKVKFGNRFVSRADAFLKKLDRSIATFEAKSTAHNRMKELVRWIKMDKALLHVWKSRALIANKKDPMVVRECIKFALEIYLELDRDSDFSKETLLKFRLAAAFVLNDDYETALEKLKQACALLPKDTRIPKNHILRISIPRQYSYVLWRSKQDIWSLGALHKDFNHRTREQVDILLDCRNVISECIRSLKSLKDGDDIVLEKIKVWNNFIAYTWELRDLGQTINLSTKEIENIRDAIGKIEQHIPQHTRKLSGLDTAMKGADLIGDVQTKIRLLGAVRRELKMQRTSHKHSEGYTAEELEFLDYCLGRIRKR
jgi:ppGpp synthetase/RelA/SpoT-type nucleotidyltranferase